MPIRVPSRSRVRKYGYVKTIAPVCVQFSASSYTASSSAVVITVERIGGTDKSISVDYATADGTALSGTNYTAVSGTLEWDAGDSSSKTFNVPILIFAQSLAAFSLVLSSPVNASICGGAEVGGVATVTIPADFKAALVVTGSNQSSSGTLNFGEESYDLGDWHDLVTNNDRLTVPSNVSFVRVIGRSSTITGQEQIMRSEHTKNGSTFIGAGGQDGQSVTTDHVSFSSGPVPVVAGNYFSQIINSNSSDTSWMSIEAVDPFVKMALVYKNSTQSIAAGEWTALSFQLELHDGGGFFSGSGTKFIIPPGVSAVQINGFAETDSIGGVFRMETRVNGSVVYGCPRKAQQTSGAERLSVSSATLLVSDGDELEVWVQATDGAVIQSTAWMSIIAVPVTYARALVYKTSAQAIGGTVSAAEWGGVAYDDANFVSSDTTFTIPSGYTQARIAFCGEYDGNSGGQSIMIVRKNGVSTAGMPVEHSEVDGINACAGISAWSNVSAGDTFEVFVAANNNGTWEPNDNSFFFIEAR